MHSAGRYINAICFVVLFILSISFYVNAETIHNSCISSEEQTILNALKNDPVSSVDLVTALLFAEGMTDSLTISDFKNKMDQFISGLNQKIKIKDSHHKKSKIIFEQLHRQLFGKYVIEALIYNTFKKYEYNCVTATAIYYLVCQRFQIPIMILQTPTHVYPALYYGDRRVDIELTDPSNGFDFNRERDDLIKYLLEYKLITEEELMKEGYDAIYSRQIEETTEISPGSLIDVTYYNRSIFLLQDKKYQEALCSLEKALFLKPEHKTYRSVYLSALLSVIPPQIDFTVFIPFLERAVTFFKGDIESQKSLLLPIGRTMEYYDSEQNYEGGVQFLDRVRYSLTPDSLISKTMNEYDKSIHFQWTASVRIRGEYEETYIKMNELRKRFLNDRKITDFYVLSACDYAHHLLNEGKSQTALQLLDSLITFFPDYPIARGVYIDALVKSIDFSDIKKEDFAHSQELLLKAYSLAPTDRRVVGLLIFLHHEMAMALIRKNKINEAYKIIQDGLRYDETDKILHQDIKNIEEYFKKKKKYPT